MKQKTFSHKNSYKTLIFPFTEMKLLNSLDLPPHTQKNSPNFFFPINFYRFSESLSENILP